LGIGTGLGFGETAPEKALFSGVAEDVEGLWQGCDWEFFINY